MFRLIFIFVSIVKLLNVNNLLNSPHKFCSCGQLNEYNENYCNQFNSVYSDSQKLSNIYYRILI